MAKDRKGEKEEKEAQTEPQKKSKGKLIIIISCAAGIILAAGGTGWYLFSKPEQKKPQVQEQAVLSIWPMEAFIINIADTNGDRYLKLVIQLEVSDSSVIPELEKLKPRLRDSILDLLTSKPYKDLIDQTGKQRLREDIAGRVNNILSKGKVTKVYFTDYVMQ
jgi:flagellar protein FliL